MPRAPDHSRARDIPRRAMSALAGLVGLAMVAGCGESPSLGVRGVVPVALESEAVPALRTLTPDFDQRLDIHLERAERHVVDLALAAGRQYTMELRFNGERPFVRDASLRPGDDASPGESAVTFARSSPLPGDPEPGLERRILRPTTGRVRVEISAGGSGSALESLLVRRWGSSGSQRQGEQAGWRSWGVYGDHRVATLLQPSAVLHWESVVPAGATALAFELVPDPSRPTAEPPARGLQVLVHLDPVGDGPPAYSEGALSVPVRAARTAWQPVVLELSGRTAIQPGQRIRVTLSPRDAGGGPAAEAVAISAPVWMCTDGPRRPNLVLISLDTTRPDHLGLYGYARDTSPHLDSLAERSVVFDAAQSTAPYTLPAHATMFSGQYPTTHGAEHPAHALDPRRTPLLAALLSDAGYATRAFTGGGYLDGDFGFAHGFGAYSNNDPVVPIEGQKVLDIQVTDAGRRYVEARTAQHWSAALEWVERNQDVPFFLFLQTFAIHDYRPQDAHRELFGGPARGEGVIPLRNPPDQLEQPYTPQEIAQLVDLYDGAIHEVDALIGELMDTLRRLGLADDTIVVVTADHGEDFAEHDVDGQPFVGHGQGLWQTLLHVPLVVHVPWMEPRRIAERVSTVDLAPTLLDLLDVPAAPAMQGRSLRGLLESGAGPVSPVVSELHSNRGAMRALISGDLKVVTGDPQALVSWPVPTAVQLYDLGADPAEQQDVGRVQQVTAGGLSAALRAFAEALEEQRDAGPTEVTLSEETRRRLEELGYVDG